MLHAGLSLAIFKKWASDEKNMVIIPGYCVAGTVGHKVLSGQKKIEMDRKSVIDVRMQVEYMSFSAHADAKGIMQLIRMAEPRNVMLVHGENEKMKFLMNKIEAEFSIPCFKPANGESITIDTPPYIEVDIDTQLLSSAVTGQGPLSKRFCHNAEDVHPIEGILVMRESGMTLMEPQQALKDLGLTEQQLRFTSNVPLPVEAPKSSALMESLHSQLKHHYPDITWQHLPDGGLTFCSVMVQATQGRDPTQPEDAREFQVSWSFQDDDLGSKVAIFSEEFIQSHCGK